MGGRKKTLGTRWGNKRRGSKKFKEQKIAVVVFYQWAAGEKIYFFPTFEPFCICLIYFPMNLQGQQWIPKTAIKLK